RSFLGPGGPPPVPASPWPCSDGGLPSAARLESLRRSIEMVSRVLGPFHRTLFSQHHQIPSLAYVSPDDSRPRPGRSRDPRTPLLFLRQPPPCFRPRPVFLFSLPPGAGPRFRRAAARVPVRLSFLLVAAAAFARRSTRGLSSGLRLQPARRVLDLDRRRGHQLPALSVVREAQKPPPRPVVAFLPLAMAASFYVRNNTHRPPTASVPKGASSVARPRLPSGVVMRSISRSLFRKS